MIPYFISSHPGATLEDACELSVFLKKNGFVPDQVQDFYPTPGTLSTCMFYTGIDPSAKERVYVPSDPEEKRLQRAMLHFNKPENADLVRKALRLLGRTDLIGYGPEALVRPESEKNRKGVRTDPGRRDNRGATDRKKPRTGWRARQFGGQSSRSPPAVQRKKAGKEAFQQERRQEKTAESPRRAETGNQSAGAGEERAEKDEYTP